MTKVKDLKSTYYEEVQGKLKKDLNIENTHAVPKITKITLNSGIGTYMKNNNKDFESVVNNLSVIAGQKPVINKAKKSVSNFKIREGDIIGVSVTLRGENMYHFLNKVINIVLPRVRDFRGCSPRSFDGNGNYNLGFKEHTVFPEISPDEVSRLHGVQMTISTTASDNSQAHKLLEEFGFPFKKQLMKNNG